MVVVRSAYVAKRSRVRVRKKVLTWWVWVCDSVGAVNELTILLPATLDLLPSGMRSQHRVAGISLGGNTCQRLHT